ncbi:hypothetical protein FA13DRAFT_1624001, partial [Coprinellus micaceus]
ANCPKCGTLENPEHILTKCEGNRKNKIWKCTKEILAMRRINFSLPKDLGDVLLSFLPIIQTTPQRKTAKDA